ncbi:unnamed protein product [Xylocopa violacea]|uniref:Uncharacterized protein n=1 Tax=Xylocopa violacea TaxID=135666 RepID=A0ABP1P5D6_XYLVO
MVPVPPNPCPYGPPLFRIAQSHQLPVPPNHVVLYSFCPCGMHRTHFVVHRNVLLNHMGRNHPITHNVQAQPHLQRLAEIQLQARLRRYVNRKEHDLMQMDDDQEEFVDR